MSEEELAAIESEWQELNKIEESGGKLSSVAVKLMALEDVPKLLAEVRRLQVALKQAKCKHPYYKEIEGDLNTCADCGLRV
jgi:hypothetical protein